MASALDDVLLEAPGDRIIKSFSGGQQARLLLAAALIQDPTCRRLVAFAVFHPRDR